MSNTAGLVPGYPDFDQTVYCIAVVGNYVFVGGAFATVGGEPRNGLCAINIATKALMPWDPGLDFGATVYDLKFINGCLYVGGEFTQVYGGLFTRNYGMAFNLLGAALTTGINFPQGISVAPWDPNTDGVIRSIAFPAPVVPNPTPPPPNFPNIIIGGGFTKVGGVSRHALASVTWTPSGGGGVLTPWNPNPDSSVVSVLSVFGRIYIAGDFDNIGGQPRSKAAAYDYLTNTLLSWDPSADSQINMLKEKNGVIYAAGFFQNIGGQARNAFAALDAVTGLATAWDPGASALDSGDDFGFRPGGVQIYLGGSYATLGGISRTNLASVAYGVAGLSDFDPQPNFEVFATTPYGPDLFVGGDFSTICGQSASRFARLTDITPPIPPPVPPQEIPRSPVIDFLERISTDQGELTLLKWEPVTRDVANNDANIIGYRVYRTSSPNLEDPELVTEVTTVDSKSFVDTMFTETLDGFFQYCVSAFNSAGESRKSCIASVAQAQSERL